MLTPELQQGCLAAARLPLKFLVRPEYRVRKPPGMEDFSESACFHRLRNLGWTISNPEVATFLSPEQQAALAEFERAYHSLPWQVIEAHPHISQLPDDDLSPLVPVGARLLHLIEPRSQHAVTVA